MIVRLVRLLGRAVGGGVVATLGLLAALEFALHRRIAPASFMSWRRTIYRRWARAVCFVMGVRVEHSGDVPEAPFLLVSNHLSYLDIAVLASLRPGRFVAKAEIRHWPIVGWLCLGADTIFVDRSSRRDVVRVERDMVRALEEGDGVILFPEGTSGRGDVVMPFKPSLLAWPARTGQPVHVAAVRYATPGHEAAPDMSVAWWGAMSFGPHLIRMLQLSRIDAHVTFSTTPVTGADRKQLTETLRTEVSSLFVPLRQTSPCHESLKSDSCAE